MTKIEPMFVYMGGALLLLFLALPMLFIAWPLVGMLLCCALAYACILRGIWITGTRQKGW